MRMNNKIIGFSLIIFLLILMMGILKEIFNTQNPEEQETPKNNPNNNPNSLPHQGTFQQKNKEQERKRNANRELANRKNDYRHVSVDRSSYLFINPKIN